MTLHPDRRLMEAVEEASTPLDDTTQEQGDIRVLAYRLQLICLCCCICNGDAGTVDQVVSDTTFVTWIDLGKGDELVNLMVVKSTIVNAFRCADALRFLSVSVF